MQTPLPPPLHKQNEFHKKLKGSFSRQKNIYVECTRYTLMNLLRDASLLTHLFANFVCSKLLDQHFLMDLQTLYTYAWIPK